MTVSQVINFILEKIYEYSNPTQFVTNVEEPQKDALFNKLLVRLPNNKKLIAKDITNMENRFFSRLGGNPITRFLFKRSASLGVLPKSADMLHMGDKNMEVTGVLITFSISIEVIRKAIDKNCNFIITHEPTFYTHHDSDERICKTDLYKEKRELLEEHHIAVWRFHDLCHLLDKDFIIDGILHKTDYQEFVTNRIMNMMLIERETSLCAVMKEMKERLGACAMRFVGNQSMPVKRYTILAGMPDNISAIQFMEKYDLDLVIVGEINEWELGDFVRDSIELGKHRALLVIGHQPSEEAGMEYFADWLKERMPEQKIKYVKTKSYFQIAHFND